MRDADALAAAWIRAMTGRPVPAWEAGVSKPLLLDLFAGAGGAARGYQRAGFYVVGVDHRPQPRYAGDELLREDVRWLADVLETTRLRRTVAIHASPPCQRYTHMGQRFPETQAARPDLIGLTRELLEATGLPYVIENVMGARRELRSPVRLCGSSLGLGVHRHRLFETNWPLLVPPCAHAGRVGLPVYGKLDGRRLWTRADGSELRAAASLEEAGAAMGIDWMTWDELREAIPPAMTELIGHQLMQVIRAREAA